MTLHLRRLAALPLPLALVAAFATGCCHLPYIYFANGVVESSAEETNAKGPTLDIVVDAKRLATVKRVAVVPFRDLSYRDDEPLAVFPDQLLSGIVTWNHDSAGELFAEHFEEVLLTSGAVEVVERSRLKAVFDEKALQAAGVVSDAMLPDVVAGSAGADAVLVGTITQGTLYRPDRAEVVGSQMLGVSVRLIDTRDGRILAAGRDFMMDAERIPEPQRLMRTIAERVLKPLTDALSAAHKANPDVEMPEREDYMAPPAPAVPSSDEPALPPAASKDVDQEQVGVTKPAPQAH